MSKAERLQLILSLLKTSPGIRPADLAARCRVSERSIFRDLHALQAIGLPVYFDRGYRLPSPTFLPALYLTGEEALALRVAANRETQRNGPMAHALASAESKLALRLGPGSPILGSQMPLQLSGVQSPTTEINQVLSLVEEAIATGRRLTIQYAKRDKGRLRSTEVEPRHLSLRENGWLLMADDPGTRRSLTIRIDQIKVAAFSKRKGSRIRPARRSKAAASPPTALRVRLRLHSPLSALAPDGALPFGLEVEEKEGGVVLLTSQASGVWELLGWLLSFGPAVEVLEPVALRAEVRRVARELSALYQTET